MNNSSGTTDTTRNSGTLAEGERKTEPESNEAKGKKNITNVSKWADLGDDLLNSISNRLNMVEFLTLGRVCRKWRLFSLTFMPWRLPLVFCVSKTSTYLYDIYSKIKYYHLPFYYSDQINVGFSSGYLIMEDDVSRIIWAVNPITSHHLHFPPMPAPELRSSRGPTTSGCSYRVILAYFGPHQQQRFLLGVLSKEYRQLLLWNSRDNIWKIQSCARSREFEDIVVFDGRMFVITTESRIGILDVRSARLKFLKLENAPCLSRKIRFLASDEQLFVVCFIEDLVIQVYLIDFSRGEWIKVTRLGADTALFISDKVCSMLSNTARWRARSNCIYYLPYKRRNNRSCYLLSLEGETLERLPINERRHTMCWYFPHQSCNNNHIDIVEG